MKCNITLPTMEQLCEFNKKTLNKNYDRSQDVFFFCNLPLICCGKDIKGSFLTSTRDIDKDGNVCVKSSLIDQFNSSNCVDRFNLVPINSPNVCYHPAIKFSSIPKDAYNNVVKNSKGKIIEISYGRYPLMHYSSKSITKELDSKLKKGILVQTGKEYTILDKKFIEYADSSDKYNCTFIKYIDKSNKSYWFDVGDIYWMVDEKLDLAISVYPLVSGIPLTTKPDYYGDIEDTNIKKFLDECFSIEILPVQYYQLEKAMIGLNIDDKIKKICYELINENYYENMINYTADMIFYELKSKYPTLNEDEYKNIVAVMLKVQSMILKNPSYHEILKKKITDENKKRIEDIKKKMEEEQKNNENELAKQKFDNLITRLITNMPKDIDDTKLIAYIYKTAPYLTDEGLKEVITALNLRKQNSEDENKKLI